MKCRVAIEELHQYKTTLGTRVNKRGSKHKKTAQEPARYISPVDLTLTELSASVKPMVQSLQHENTSTG